MACSPLSLTEWRIESGKAAAATDAEFYGPTAGLCVPTERRPRPAFAFGSREGKRERQTADLSRERGRCGLKGFVSTLEKGRGNDVDASSKERR